MRRRTFVLLVVAVLLIFGVRLIGTKPTPNGDSFEGRVNLVQHSKPLTPIDNPSLAELQNLVDKVSEAAMKDQWNTAITAVKELEQTWVQIQTSPAHRLEIEQRISASIQNLHYNVYGKDQQATLLSAQKLTDLIGQLSS